MRDTHPAPRPSTLFLQNESALIFIPAHMIILSVILFILHATYVHKLFGVSLPITADSCGFVRAVKAALFFYLLAIIW